MIKTDQKTLEELSFAFNEQDIARFKHLLDILKRGELTDLDENKYLSLINAFDKIGELKLNGKIYGFKIDDSYAARQGGDAGEGVELFRRQGDRLEEFAVNGDRDWVLKVDQIVPKLKKNKIDRIYTGIIRRDKDFLGIPYESDKEDPLFRAVLDDFYISQFREEGIEVIVLDELI